MIIILILWLLLIFIGIKYEKEPISNPLSRDATLVLKGICAIEIMLGHLGLATGSIVLFANRKAGILFVGIFLALSGYGLMYNLCNKENYLNGFFKQRVLKILLPAYIIYAFGILVLNKPWSYMFNIHNFFNETNWYVWEIIALYILFYIGAKFLSHKHLCYAIFIASIIFIIIAFLFKIDSPWYGSTLCFPLGIYYYLNKNDIYEKYIGTAKYKWVICISVFLLCTGILSFFVLGEESFIGNLIGRNVASIAFVILVCFLLYHFRLGNSFSRWLGKYSYEIFLFHFVFIKVFNRIENDILFSLAVIVCTIISSMVYSTLMKCVKGDRTRNVLPKN